MAKRLTLEQKLQSVCFHSFGATKPNWVVDRTHGHPVCCFCGKPSPELILRKCFEEDCGDEFVLNFGPDWLPKYFVHEDGKVYERAFFCSKHE